ncbi:hypothetical protein GHK78_13055 [Sinorhizobium meliloti]|uniref:hypothetical protein n=1 Tax=Rhizobium meliloti TaxID=382 RepID=UPI00129559E3|nr:hypothetical protein [Sinorhizobium meliloti]MQX63961.1 hypothetical protein [Sinorhizobium meliloti]
MLLRVAYPYNSEQSALQLSLTHERLEPPMKDAESYKGLSAFNDLADRYGHHLPGNPADLFNWLLEQPQDMVLMLLAFGAAHWRTPSMRWRRSLPTGRMASSRRISLAEHSK